jgi:hypothetical protein
MKALSCSNRTKRLLLAGKRPTTLWTGCCIGSISAFIAANLILSKADGQLQDAENFTLAGASRRVGIRACLKGSSRRESALILKLE